MSITHLFCWWRIQKTSIMDQQLLRVVGKQMREWRNDGQGKKAKWWWNVTVQTSVGVNPLILPPLQSNQMFALIRWTVAAQLMLSSELCAPTTLSSLMLLGGIGHRPSALICFTGSSMTVISSDVCRWHASKTNTNVCIYNTKMIFTEMSKKQITQWMFVKDTHFSFQMYIVFLCVHMCTQIWYYTLKTYLVFFLMLL